MFNKEREIKDGEEVLINNEQNKDISNEENIEFEIIYNTKKDNNNKIRIFNQTFINNNKFKSKII